MSQAERDGDDPGPLARWSRRKVQARAGVVPDEPARPTPAPPRAAPAPLAATPPPTQAAEAPALPAPTLADVAALGPDADIARFVLPGVDENVKRAALKKLFFSDPHFNLMDGLDIYIDDYGLPDPIPNEMLQRMVQSRLLGLVEDEPGPQAIPDGTPAPPLPQSPPIAAALAAPEPAQDEDPAVRLQPDDAADAAGARADRPRPRA